ncbi:20870_t:CDS:1, partial [Gigaspora rosea]
IIENKDGEYFLYIAQKVEFDLTRLIFEEKEFNKDNSIIKASHQAFDINIDIKIKKTYDYNEMEHKCKHKSTAKCG